MQIHCLLDIYTELLCYNNTQEYKSCTYNFQYKHIEATFISIGYQEQFFLVSFLIKTYCHKEDRFARMKGYSLDSALQFLEGCLRATL